MPSSRQRTTSLTIGIIILVFAEITLRVTDVSQQVVNGGILFFLRLTFVVFFIAPEAQTVLLTKTAGVKQRINRVAIIFLHPLREACGHYGLRVMCGINAHDVEQIRRAHRPAELFFHDLVDFAEVRTVAQ